MSCPRVYIQVGVDPPLAAEEAVQARVRAAGAEPFRIPPGGSRRVSWEEVMEFEPQLVLYAVRGQGRAFDPGEFLGIEGWDRTEAAVMRRVYSCDAELFDPAAGRLDEGEAVLKGLLAENFLGGSEFESPWVRRLFE